MQRKTTHLFILSTVFVVSCISYIMLTVQQGRKEVNNKMDWVAHSQAVMLSSEHFLTTLESMLSSQRGYLITGDILYLDEYKSKKFRLLQELSDLERLTDDRQIQHSQNKKLRKLSEEYIQYLEARIIKFSDSPIVGNKEDKQEFLRGKSKVESLRAEILTIISKFLEDEKNLLHANMDGLEKNRQHYRQNLAMSLVGACVLIILSNWVVFSIQRRHLTEGERFQALEDRYTVAVKATNDGVFDWNIETKNIFLSSQIFRMCGYNKPNYDGHIWGVPFFMGGKNPLDLIHPDDIGNFHQRLDEFIDGQTLEYHNVFRVKHYDGHWIWVNARGGGIYNETGKVVRMIGSHTDITTSKQYEQRLRRDKEEAENSSKSKMEFLAHMSHEIRTPLTAITGVAEILNRHKDKLDERQQVLLKTLITSSSTLRDLLNDVLDFSKIDSGEIELSSDGIVLGQLFDEIVAIMSVQAVEKNISLISQHKNIEHLIFEGDHVRLRQILINLVGNAIKFTDKGHVTIRPHIIIQGDKAGQARLKVDVIDTGIGIDSENLEIIFDRFKQVDDTISKRYRGTGLGLPISRKLAEIMGGTIVVASEIGRGSIFTLDIPTSILNLHEINPDKLAAHEQATLPPAALPLPETQPATALQEANDNTSKRILMVEDYEGNIVVIGFALEDMNIAFDVARNGLEALELFMRNSYDAILMDLQMPKMDGVTATARIRELEREQGLAHTPIIGMTAHATYQDIDRCRQAGMDDHLTKPIHQKDLRAVVRAHTGDEGNRRQHINA